MSILVYIDGKNYTFEDMSSAHAWLGIYPFLQILYASLFIPVSFVGFFLNILNMWILCRGGSGTSRANSEFRIKLYDYLRVYTFTSIISTFLEFWFGFTQCFELIPALANQYLAQMYSCFVYSPVHNTLTFLKSSIDILIMFDRLGTLNPEFRLNLPNIIHPYKFSMGLFVMLAVVNIPYYLSYQVDKAIITNTEDEYYIYYRYIIENSEFSDSSYGKIILAMLFFFKHGVTLLLEVVLNLIFYVNLRRYFVKKNQLIANVFQQARKNKVSSAETEATHRSSLRVDITTRVPVNSINEASGSTEHPPTHPKQSISLCHSANSIERNSRMVIVHSLISILHQMSLFVYLSYSLTHDDLVMYTLRFVANFMSSLRHGSSFFVFYFFNTSFRSCLNSCLSEVKCCFSIK